MRWQVLPNPVAADGDAGAARRLGRVARASGSAAGFRRVDVLVARDRAGQLWYGAVLGRATVVAGTCSGRRGCPAVTSCAPDGDDVPLADLALVPSVGSRSLRAPARLLRVDGGQLRTFELATIGDRRGMGHRGARCAAGPGPRPAGGDGAGAAERPTAAAATRAHDRPPDRRPRRRGRHGVVRPDRRDAGRPRRSPGRGCHGAGARVDVRPAATSRSAPERSGAALGGVGRRAPGSRVARRRPTAPTASSAMPDRAGFDAAPGSSLRVASAAVGALDDPAAHDGRGHRDAIAGSGTARSWCGSTKDSARRHRCPTARPTGRRPTW